MRPSVLLAPLLLTAGCFSASSGGDNADAGFTFDAAEFDASPGDDATVPDASMVEAAPGDVATPEAGPLPDVVVPFDAGPAPTGVLVKNALGPESGVTVVFQDATGAVITAETTGATGTAEYLVPTGSQVTILLGTSLAPAPLTIQGIAPGDLLAVYDSALDATQAMGSVSIDTIPASPPPGTALYVANVPPSSNSGTGAPIVVSLNPGSEQALQFPVLLMAYAGADGGNAQLGYTWQKNNILPLDGGPAHVAMTGTWTAPASPLTETVTVSGVPALSQSLSNATLAFSQIATGVAQTRFQSVSGIGIPDAGVSNTFEYDLGYPDAIQAEVDVVAGFGQGQATTAVATRAAPPAGSSTTNVDVSQLLPFVQGATVDGTVPAQPTVAITLGDAGASGADGVVTELNWNGQNDAGAFIAGTWTIVGPPGATSLRAPQLPASASNWVPVSGANFQNPPVVVLVKASFASGYAKLRAVVGTVPVTQSVVAFAGTVVPALPVDGTLWLSAFVGGG